MATKQPLRKTPNNAPRRTWDFTFTPGDADLLGKAVRGRFMEVAVSVSAKKHLMKLIGSNGTSLQKGYVIAYTGGDHKVVEEYEDAHPFLLPLRVDVRLSRLEKALDAVFFRPFPHRPPPPGDGNVFSKNIIEFVRHMKEKRKSLIQDLRKEFSDKKVFDDLAVLFFREMAGRRLLEVITPKSREKWEKSKSREVLRPTPGLAAKVSCRLFLECFEIRFEEATLRQRFNDLKKEMSS